MQERTVPAPASPPSQDIDVASEENEGPPLTCKLKASIQQQQLQKIPDLESQLTYYKTKIFQVIILRWRAHILQNASWCIAALFALSGQDS